MSCRVVFAGLQYEILTVHRPFSTGSLNLLPGLVPRKQDLTRVLKIPGVRERMPRTGAKKSGRSSGGGGRSGAAAASSAGGGGLSSSARNPCRRNDRTQTAPAHWGAMNEQDSSEDSDNSEDARKIREIPGITEELEKDPHALLEVEGSEGHELADWERQAGCFIGPKGTLLVPAMLWENTRRSALGIPTVGSQEDATNKDMKNLMEEWKEAMIRQERYKVYMGEDGEVLPEAEQQRKRAETVARMRVTWTTEDFAGFAGGPSSGSRGCS